MTLVINQQDFAPLVAKTKYEDIAAEIELPQFRVRLPDRSAKIILESPTLAELDPEFGEFEGFQRRKAVEQAKRAEMERVAHDTGAPVHLLRALETRPSISIDPTAHDEQHARAYQLGLDEEMMAVQNAVQAEQNVQTVANQARRMLTQASRANPLEFILAEQDDDELPIEYAPQTPEVPSVPVPYRMAYRDDYERAARALREAGMTQTSALDLANTALQTTTAVANAGAAIAPMAGDAARGLMQVLPPIMQGTGSALMMGGRLALGSARLGSRATRNVFNALGNLSQARLPVSHRGHDHLERQGINIADGFNHFVHNHRM